MRKGGAFARMISVLSALLLLAGCAAGGTAQDTAQQLQEEYRALSACDLTATVRCQTAEEVADYVLQCHWAAEGVSSVEILQPAELAGICAEFDAGELTLVYEDISLAAGAVGDTGVSPAQVLPLLVEAVREGYVLEKGAESMAQENCLRLLFDTTLGDEKLQYAVWFGSGHAPVQAEVMREGAVVFQISISDFSAEMAAA